jgi:3-dehydro-L-gulonate 2-dehydrogenase
MGAEGFEPSKAEPSDLQSDPFVHFGTRPFSSALSAGSRIIADATKLFNPATLGRRQPPDILCNTMPRVPFTELVAKLTALFSAAGVPQTRAHRLAKIFTQASADGVYSHGVHFVPGLLRDLRNGKIADLKSDPKLVSAFGAMERYDGNLGLGPLNAEFSMDRAMELAGKLGVGCVALRNTTHWGRPGNLGWRAAERGYLAICWTNTPALMPNWGGTQKAVGNNPLVLAAPGTNQEHLVLDMAMSQFSMGRMGTHKAENQPLPVIGGIDATGKPTADAAAILNGGLPYPIGFWKGSGLAILLDAFAAILADGNDTSALVPGQGDRGVSQVFLAFQPNHLNGRPAADRTREILQNLAQKNPEARYPGEAALANRRQSEAEGVYVRGDIWQELMG